MCLLHIASSYAMKLDGNASVLFWICGRTARASTRFPNPIKKNRVPYICLMEAAASHPTQHSTSNLNMPQCTF